MKKTEIYQQARVKARRTLTFRLSRQEQRIIAQASERRPSRDDLIRLGVIRAELVARRAGLRRARPFLRPWAA